MNDLTVEEVITMLYGMKLINGLSWAEREVLQAAIDHLEKGAENESRDNEGLD